MSMIEVDHKLFITCRLCIDETGVFQIVPDVINKIKYCFDIEVELLYGLPQLICRKCMNVLNEYAQVKQSFQSKQNNLLSKYKGNVEAEIINNQQNTVSSTQQTCTESQSHGVDREPKAQTEKNVSHRRHTSLDTSYTVASNIEHESSTKTNPLLKQWQKDYKKQFVCSFCSKALNHKKSIIHHIQRCPLLKKYSHLLKRCSVDIENIDTNPNLTGSFENVVFNKTRIIGAKDSGDYHVVYSLKSPIKNASSESSDEDFVAKRNFHKRRRLSSECSNETVILENNEGRINNLISTHEEGRINNVISTDDEGAEKTDNNCNDKNIPHESDVEFVVLDDSDTESGPPGTAKLKTSGSIKDAKGEARKTVVNDIVSMCRAKYLKRFDGRNNSKDNKGYSFLQRKLLSIGRKVINKEGFNATGLLRYMEQKDLDVVWVPKQEANVAVNTILKDNKNKSAIEEDSGIWKSLNNSTETKDFIDRFEKITTTPRPQPKQINSTPLVLENRQNQNKEFKTTCNKDVKNTNNKEAKITTNKEAKNTTNKEAKIITNKEAKNTTNKEAKITTNKEAKNTTNKEDKITTNKEVNNIINIPSNDQEQNVKSLENYKERIEGNVLFIDTRPDAKVPNNLLKKLLNTTPVANPKQLPRKTEIVAVVEKSAKTENTPEANNAHSLEDSTDSGNLMPIITSTISLAPSCSSTTEEPQRDVASGDADTVQDNPQASIPKLPRIKVKDVSELMPNSQSIQPRGVAIPTNVWSGGHVEDMNGSGNVAVHSAAQVISTSAPVFYVVPRSSFYQSYAPKYNPAPKYVAIKPNEPPLAPKNYVIMDTVQLPNQKTDSPFKYFKELLQLHNIILVYGKKFENANKFVLIKFRLVFQQDGNPEVSLSLKLSYFQNVYCIQVTDGKLEDLSEDGLSPDWQWEVLKAFKVEIVKRLLDNAMRLSSEVFERTSQFISLLKSITVKDSF